MSFPRLPNIQNNKIKTDTINWKGYNGMPVVGPGELTDMTNLSSDFAPCISSRPSRELISSLHNGLALFPANGKLCTVDNLTFTSVAGDMTFGTATITSAASAFGHIAVGDTLTITGCTVNAGNNKTAVVTVATAGVISFAAGTFTAGAETAAITFTGCSFKYDGVTKGPVTATAKSMCDFNGMVIIAPDKKYYNYGTGAFGTVATMPDIDYVCVMNNRIWGVKASDVYATALGIYNSWDDYSGEETDSWATDVAEEGNFTGIVATQGRIICTKENYFYELYGNKPSNFNLHLITERGCIDGKSLIEVNEAPYFLSNTSAFNYDGSVPKPISLDLNETYISGVAGTDGRKYYISLYNGTAYNLYVYDTYTGVWHREDNLNVTDFAFLDNYLYALSGNDIYKFNSGTETVNFVAITDRFTEQYNGAKVASEFSMMVKMSGYAALRIYYSIDGGSYILADTILSSGYYSYTSYLKPKRGNSIQLKFEGFGDIKIYQLTRKMAIGSTVPVKLRALTWTEIEAMTWTQLEAFTWNEINHRRSA
jgi:hypothetical protein